MTRGSWPVTRDSRPALNQSRSSPRRAGFGRFRARDAKYAPFGFASFGSPWRPQDKQGKRVPARPGGRSDGNFTAAVLAGLRLTL